MNRSFLSPLSLATFACAVTCILPASLYAAPKVEILPQNPKVTVCANPVFNVSVPGLQNKVPTRQPDERAPMWIEIEADFNTAEEFQELTFKFGMVVLPVGAAKPKLLEGEVTLVDVQVGKSRHAVMYVPPKTVFRMSPPKLPFQVNTVRASWVQVYAGSEKVAERFYSNFQGATLEGVLRDKETYEKITGGLVHKDTTPFAHLFLDYYESMKPSR